MPNRRDWLKTTLGLAAGVPIAAAMADQLMAMPVSSLESKVYGKYGAAPMNLRLGSNENPYGPSERAKKAVMDILVEGNRYPFQTVNEFKTLLAEKEGVSPECIAVGAGSSDLLCATGAAFGLEGGAILSAYPTFPTLMNFAGVFRVRWDKVNVNEKLEYDYQAVARQVKNDTQLVFVCNPNNPTGTFTDPAIVKAFCDDVSQKTTVFSDEAYLEFLEPRLQVSMVELVKQDKNIIVSRTFSKIHGLAGLRVGYLVAKPDLIKKITLCQNRLSNNQVAIAAAAASLGDEAFMDMTRKKNAEARKILIDYLDANKYTYGKSVTNFVMFDPKGDAAAILSKLAERGVRIRTWDHQGRQWLRVSVGTLDEMKQFTSAFDEVTRT